MSRGFGPFFLAKKSDDDDRAEWSGRGDFLAGIAGGQAQTGSQSCTAEKQRAKVECRNRAVSPGSAKNRPESRPKKKLGRCDKDGIDSLRMVLVTLCAEVPTSQRNRPGQVGSVEAPRDGQAQTRFYPCFCWDASFGPRELAELSLVEGCLYADLDRARSDGTCSRGGLAVSVRRARHGGN